MIAGISLTSHTPFGEGRKGVYDNDPYSKLFQRQKSGMFNPIYSFQRCGRFTSLPHYNLTTRRNWGVNYLYTQKLASTPLISRIYLLGVVVKCSNVIVSLVFDE